MEQKKEHKKKFDRKLFGRIFTYVKPYKSKFVLAVIFILLLAALAISRPLLIQVTIDKYIVTKNNDMLLVMIVILIGTLIMESLLQYLNIVITSILGQNIVRDLRNEVYTHIVRLRTKYFDTTPIGMLVTRSISDVEALADVFSQGFIVIAGDIVMLLVFVGAMLWKNWEFALVVLSTIPLLLIATHFFKRGVKTTFNEVRNAVAALNTFVQEHIQGMKVVQVFNREDKEFEKFKEINAKHRDANIRSIWYYSVFFPVVEILSSLAIGLLIWYAGIRMDSLKISSGEFTFFIMLTNMMFRPIRMLADRLNTLQMGMVSAERVFKVLDTQEHIINNGTHSPEHVQGMIEFRNVWFAYNEEDYVLKNISFSVKAGETVALVGATGSGKTSVTSLLPRFYDYNKGEILLDGKNINDYELHSLRSHIGIVLQDVFLYSDTILNNITLNTSSITREQVIAAAKAVGAHDFIMQMPGDYDYNVRERGATLSVGQRQLISFIRAYVHNPSLLILDEATSSIDTVTEMLIQKATDTLTQGRTSIIVAHRLATIQKADKVIVLEKGEIKEMGSIRELLALNGHFRKLYDLQFEGKAVL
ncbi:MAG: transporter ATP-binding protein [Bacteroidetes bacterium]|nr:transporter ATP-binding protein [Bacteroidota bacterium]